MGLASAKTYLTNTGVAATLTDQASADASSGIAELADAVYSDHADYRVFAVLASRCDESWRATSVYVVAGWVGRVGQWKRLEKKWKQALWKEGLDEFHMADCEGGYGKFAGIDRPERERLQRRFIDIINDHEVYGGMGVIVLADFNALLPRLKKARKHEKYGGSPYLMAFEWCIVEMRQQASTYPAGEQINFVFDRQKEFQGRAKELYDQALQMPELSFHSRLGSLSFASRRDVVSLQAADILAYEAYRHWQIQSVGDQPRWQKQLLDKRAGGKVWDRPALEAFCTEFGV